MKKGKTMRDSVFASLTGASVFGIMCAPRGAAPLMWKQWRTTDAEALR
jgi:hypothetical protein